MARERLTVERALITFTKVPQTEPLNLSVHLRWRSPQEVLLIKKGLQSLLDKGLPPETQVYLEHVAQKCNACGEPIGDYLWWKKPETEKVDTFANGSLFNLYEQRISLCCGDTLSRSTLEEMARSGGISYPREVGSNVQIQREKPRKIIPQWDLTLSKEITSVQIADNKWKKNEPVLVQLPENQENILLPHTESFVVIIELKNGGRLDFECKNGDITIWATIGKGIDLKTGGYENYLGIDGARYFFRILPDGRKQNHYFLGFKKHNDIGYGTIFFKKQPLLQKEIK